MRTLINEVKSYFCFPDGTYEYDNPAQAFSYYKDFRFNHSTGKKEIYPISKFLSELKKNHFKEIFHKPRVYHFFYELGFLFQEIELPSNLILAIELEYTHKKKLPKKLTSNLKIQLKEAPSWKQYQQSFQIIRGHLLKGNCYQANLTFPFIYSYEQENYWRDFFSSLWSQPSTGAYAHATILSDQAYVSNSPEMFFSLSKKGDSFLLETRPIKGTRKLEGDIRKLWRDLSSDPKEKAELDIVTDLLRNDLNSIHYPLAQVLKRRHPLRVNHLFHQYSHLQVELPYSVSLYQVLSSLFPGGSITGAPKKSVMNIIHKTESWNRGFYCGSTILLEQSRMNASVNIRSAAFDLRKKTFTYGAGGGITLLSQAQAEYQEMLDKVESFTHFIGQ